MEIQNFNQHQETIHVLQNLKLNVHGKKYNISRKKTSSHNSTLCEAQGNITIANSCFSKVSSSPGLNVPPVKLVIS